MTDIALLLIVLGTIAIAVVIDLIALAAWLTEAMAMNALLQSARNNLMVGKGRSAMVQEMYQAAERGRKTQSNQQTWETDVVR
jgi:hypothetical protein